MIDALLATLERQATGEIARITEEARARADQLSAAGEQRLAERRAETLARTEAGARAQHGRALSAARAAARERVLAARTALIDRVFAMLTAELPALAGSGAYQAQLPQRVENLLRFAGEGRVTLECSPALTTTLQRIVTTNGRLRIQPDAGIQAGFRLRAEDGSVEIDGSLETEVERLRPRLALEALAALAALSS
jgi:vacuolar-type H+-ATPase subunit E/Vma4